jgi:formylglycine-generating enzyme required for sulfatase activity
LHTVGEKEPNAFGLYDMHGNVWEWCEDKCDVKDRKIVTDTYRDGVVDPVCETGSLRVIRGGGWDRDAGNCRAAYRSSGAPGYRNNLIGFRLVRTPA